jgi:hypothetical protein
MWINPHKNSKNKTTFLLLVLSEVQRLWTRMPNLGNKGIRSLGVEHLFTHSGRRPLSESPQVGHCEASPLAILIQILSLKWYATLARLVRPRGTQLMKAAKSIWSCLISFCIKKIINLKLKPLETNTF